MTLREYIYAVKNPPNGGMTSRSSEVGERLVAQWITKYRNMLAAQSINKSGTVDSSLEQDLGCLVLTKADVSMCQKYCYGENTWYVDLPQLLELDNNAGLTFFGLIDKQTKIPISEYSYGSFSNFNRFVPKTIYGELIGNRVFLHNIDPNFPLEVVNARGVWAQPQDLVTRTSKDAPVVCFDWDKDRYPMLSKYDAALFEMIYTKELGILRNSITDKTDDDTTAEKV